MWGTLPVPALEHPVVEGAVRTEPKTSESQTNKYDKSVETHIYDYSDQTERAIKNNNIFVRDPSEQYLNYTITICI